MASWIKWPAKGNLQAESGMPAYKSLWDCLSTLQGGNFQEHHSTILQPQVSDHSTERCIKKRTWSSTTTKLYSGNVCIQSIDWKWEELSELGERVSCNHLGNGMFHYFLYGKEFYSGDRPEATCVNLQEAHGGNFSQHPEIGGKKFSIPAFQCEVQEMSGNSTGRCSE